MFLWPGTSNFSFSDSCQVRDRRFDSSSGPKQRSKRFLAQVRQCLSLFQRAKVVRWEPTTKMQQEHYAAKQAKHAFYQFCAQDISRSRLGWLKSAKSSAPNTGFSGVDRMVQYGYTSVSKPNFRVACIINLTLLKPNIMDLNIS